MTSKNRKAIVLVHGMGNQIPLTSIRDFVEHVSTGVVSPLASIFGRGIVDSQLIAETSGWKRVITFYNAYILLRQKDSKAVFELNKTI